MDPLAFGDVPSVQPRSQLAGILTWSLPKMVLMVAIFMNDQVPVGMMRFV